VLLLDECADGGEHFDQELELEMKGFDEAAGTACPPRKR